MRKGSNSVEHLCGSRQKACMCVQKLIDKKEVKKAIRQT